MKTIINKTRRPLKIKLSQGRGLRLGPSKEGQIATQDAEREVEVFDNSSSDTGAAGKGKSGTGQSQGFHRQFSGSKRGDR